MYHFFRLRQIMISSFVLDLSLKKEKDSFPPSEYNDWRSLMADAFFFLILLWLHIFIYIWLSCLENNKIVIVCKSIFMIFEV